MTRTTPSNMRSNVRLNIRRSCLAAVLVLAPASLVLAQDESADLSSEQAAGGTCTAQSGLGELSLSGASSTATVALTQASADAPEADIAPQTADGESRSAPTPGGPDADGFISLAGGDSVSANECAAAGAPSSAPDRHAAASETLTTSAAEPASEAPTAIVSTAAVSIPAKRKPEAPRRQQPPREASKVWWTAPEPGRLNLRFAGEAAFGQAIALLFDAPFADPASADTHVQVLNRAGKALKGKWQVVKSNPQMLALKAEPGTYTIRIGAELSASNGLQFKQAAEGKVFVR